MQTDRRRCVISVSAGCKERVRAAAAARGTSMANIVERAVAPELGTTPPPALDHAWAAKVADGTRRAARRR